MARKRVKKPEPIVRENVLLVEVAWEVCNQVGGIYTVIRSKISAMMTAWEGRYCMIGPYMSPNIMAELEIINDADDPFCHAARRMREKGHDVIYAEWLVTGRPRVILVKPEQLHRNDVSVAKYHLWKEHGIGTPETALLLDQVISFSYLTKLYLEALVEFTAGKTVIGHFHEWMAGLPILDIRKKKLPIRTIFTTHATLLGRYLAVNSPTFYEHLPFFDWEAESKRFGIEPEVRIEAACANQADLFTTVSEVTAQECIHLLKRKPEFILPNGLNIERFEALHEFQNLHAIYKEEIHRFVMGHFFQSYSFDLDKTLYFFTSGRYEYKNKGFDLTLEALDWLNKKLIEEEADFTVVMFFITRRDFTSINPQVLQSRAMMEELSETCNAIQQQVGKRLFYAGTTREDNRLPDLNQFVDEYWNLRYRRTIQSWRSNKPPAVLTHMLTNESDDDIMKFVRRRKMFNEAGDKVKIVYHPDFITATNPLFGIEYAQFVRGCHLGVFPSYYEPWGYTPLECMASGVPAITSDLSGFGVYLQHYLPAHEESGMYVIERAQRSFDNAAKRLAVVMYEFLKQTRRERIMQRNNVENSASIFDWQNLIKHYNEAYDALLNA